MTRHLPAWIVVTGVLTAANGALAQEAAPPSPLGQRVRVRHCLGADCHRTVGRLVALSGDTLVIAGDPASRIPLSRVQRLEAWGGRRSHWGEALALGVAGGAITGGVVGIGLDDRSDNELGPEAYFAVGALAGAGLGLITATTVGAFRLEWWSGALVGGGVFLLSGLAVLGMNEDGYSTDRAIDSPWMVAVPGALFGALVGAVNAPNRWETVPKERLRVGVAPDANGGLALVASFRL